MNVTLKLNRKNMSKFVKQISSLDLRITVNFSNSTIVMDIDDNNIQTFINSIGHKASITTKDFIETADSIELDKIKFSNEVVQEQINKLIRVISWAMHHNHADAQDICKYILTASTEIAMKNNPTTPTTFTIGDIVDCNYGAHLESEISGGHVHSIVCDVCHIFDDDLVYVVPIAKEIFDMTPSKYLPFRENIDVKYNDTKFIGGTVLLKMGRYIHRQRINKVVGYVLPEFFEEMLLQLSSAIDFYTNSIGYQNSYKNKSIETSNNVQDDCSIPSTEVLQNQKGQKDRVEPPVIETFKESMGTTPTEKSNSNTTKKISVENYLANVVITNALNCLNPVDPIEQQLDTFLGAIGFSNEELIKRSFIVACKIDKISYESILTQLYHLFPNSKEETMKATLQKEFKKWLNNHSEVKIRYPKVSVMTLLKVFAKKWHTIISQ